MARVHLHLVAHATGDTLLVLIKTHPLGLQVNHAAFQAYNVMCMRDGTAHHGESLLRIRVPAVVWRVHRWRELRLVPIIVLLCYGARRFEGLPGIISYRKDCQMSGYVQAAETSRQKYFTSISPKLKGNLAQVRNQC